jgi:hypothetical protein
MILPEEGVPGIARDDDSQQRPELLATIVRAQASIERELAQLENFGAPQVLTGQRAAHKIVTAMLAAEIR